MSAPVPPLFPSPPLFPPSPVVYFLSETAFSQSSILSYCFGIFGGIVIITGLYYADSIHRFCRGGQRGLQNPPQSIRSAGLRQHKDDDGVPAEVIERLPVRIFLKLKPGSLKEEDDCCTEDRGSCLSVVVMVEKKEDNKVVECLNMHRGSEEQGDAAGKDKTTEMMQLPGQVDNAACQGDACVQSSSFHPPGQASSTGHRLPAELHHESDLTGVEGKMMTQPNTSAAQSSAPDATSGSEAADSDTTCIVCLLDYEDGDVLRQLPCRHNFHKDCIDSWLKHHRTCPICRKELVPPPVLNPSDALVIEMSTARQSTAPHAAALFEHTASENAETAAVAFHMSATAAATTTSAGHVVVEDNANSRSTEALEV